MKGLERQDERNARSICDTFGYSNLTDRDGGSTVGNGFGSFQSASFLEPEGFGGYGVLRLASGPVNFEKRIETSTITSTILDRLDTWCL